MHACTYILIVILLLGHIKAEYQCLCNYNVEWKIYSQASETSQVLGYMYEFDCLPTATSTTADDWFTIAYEHTMGFVRKDAHQNIVINTCQGDVPPSDMLTTTKKIDIPNTSTSAVTETSTTAKITSSQPTPAPTTTLPTSTPSTRTYTSIITTKFTTKLTLAPTPLTTTSTTSLPTTPRHIIKGNVSLCPAKLHQYTREDGGALTQYDDSCYELVPIRTIWAKAENDCRAKGGHLFHVENRDVQYFIYKWIKSFNFDHAVWTGLHDLIDEEYFQWISGEHLLYTNWYPDRLGNLASHYIENCVLLVPYAPYYGQWDDVQCGTTTTLGDSGQQNPFICQYPLNPHHFSQAGIVVG